VGLLGRLRSRDLVPRHDRAALHAEGVVVDEKNVSMTVRFRDFRAPGRVHKGRITRFRSALVVTNQRLVVFMGRDRLLDAPFASPATRDALELTATDDGLGLAFDAAGFHPDRSGQVRVLVRVADPQQVVDHVRGRLRS
jgi:hypothetical protein